MLTVFLLSLIGVPLTGGFFGKFYIFQAALESHLIWLAVLGLLNSAVAAYYYLRLMVVMYMHEPGEVTNELEAPGSGAARGAGAAGDRARSFSAIIPGTVLVLHAGGRVIHEVAMNGHRIACNKPYNYHRRMFTMFRPYIAVLAICRGSGAGNFRGNGSRQDVSTPPPTC